MQANRALRWAAFAAILFCGPVQAQQPRWQTTLESAKRLASQTNQLVLIHFWAPYCTACRRMEQETFPDPMVAATIQTYYVPVKINTEYFPATANQFGITNLPTDVIITPQGQVLSKTEGMLKAPDYAARLNHVATSFRPQSPPAVYAQVPQAQPAQPGSAAYPPATAVAAAPQAPATVAMPQTPAYQPAPQAPAYQPAPIAQPVASASAAPVAALPSYAIPSATAPQAIPAQTSSSTLGGQLPPASPYGVAIPPAVAANPAGPATPSPQPAPGAAPGLSTAPATPAAPGAPMPQLGLDGFCPVRLVETQKWVPGDRRWGVIHQGRVYLFSGPNEQARFYANPDMYAPVISGNDVIVALETGQMVPGLRQHGVYYGNHIYLFSSEQSLQKFEREPERYVAAVQQVLRNNAPQPR
jgi:protein disulfide-isomerase